MSTLRDKLPAWTPQQRAVGETAYKRAAKGLEKALIASWRACGENVTAVPRDKLEVERAKFRQTATGDFSDQYLHSVEEVIKHLTANTDLIGWLAKGYAPFAAGLVNGLLDNTMPFDPRRPEMVESLLRSVFMDAAVVVHYFLQAEQTELTIKSIGEGLDHLANGDLTHRVTADLTGSFAKLKTDFNRALDHLQETVRDLQASAREITTGSAEISKAADDLSRRTEQQAASLEETAATLEEITATVKQTTANTREASKTVEAAKHLAESGGKVVETAVGAMDAISQSSKKITDIIGVIDEIAFQTNLLALNAGVEAARAGDAGRGFAVVASEVRALAQRSSEAAKQIKTLIHTSSEQVGAGVKFVGESGEALKRIVDQVVKINALVNEMALAAEQQSSGIEQVNAAVAQMDQVTQQNAAMVEQSTAASRNLAQESETLGGLASFFTVGGQSAAPERTSAAPARVNAKPRLVSPRARSVRQASAAVVKKAAPEPADDWTEF